MAVDVYGFGGEINGYGDAMDAFRGAEEQNARILLNLEDIRIGRERGIDPNKLPKKNSLRAPYDPNHPDNKWPVMVYHAALGYKVIGQNLKGLTGALRIEAEKANQVALKAAQAENWRLEQYPKPQVALLDPAAEKAALVARNVELEGKIVALTDSFTKLMARLDAIEKGK